jgi:hypothetical protein
LIEDLTSKPFFMKTQTHFFQKIKPGIPHYTSLAAEVATALQISVDSAYRRIRGEKLLNFNEISLVCQFFNVSMDEFLCLNTNSILFQSSPKRAEEDALMHWLEDLYGQLHFINSHPRRHLYFLINDLPPFHHFYHPLLASFKIFFWMRSILPLGLLDQEKFNHTKNYLSSYETMIQKIVRAYTRIPSTELWNKDALNTTIRQIESYQDMGLMADKDITRQVYSSLLEVIDHLEKMAIQGKKSVLGQEPSLESATYTLYLNDIVSGDNTVMAEIGEAKITYLNHSVLYFVGSKDRDFNESTFRNMENLIKKSSLLSGSGEKERTLVFNKLRKKVLAKMEGLDR